MSKQDKYQTHTGEYHGIQADAYDVILFEGERHSVFASYVGRFPTNKAADQ